MVEGVLCPHCHKRIPLVEFGEHEVVEHDTIGGRDCLSPAPPMPNVGTKRRTSYKRKERDIHDPERIAGGIRNRPWSQRSLYDPAPGVPA